MGIKSRPVTAVVITLVLCMLVGCSDDESVTEVKQSKTIFINFFKINPLATYLHVCSDPGDPWYDDGALNAQPILLADYNIVPGDSLKFDVIGDFFNGNNPRSRVIAVFSSSETLLNGSETQRVPGALEAGEDFVTIDVGMEVRCGNGIIMEIVQSRDKVTDDKMPGCKKKMHWRGKMYPSDFGMVIFNVKSEGIEIAVPTDNSERVVGDDMFKVALF